MAKHKAPTQVTLASRSDQPATSFLEENRWWIPLAGLAVLIAAGVLVWQFLGERSEAAAARSWDRVNEVTNAGGDPAALAAVAEEQKDSPAGPWARMLEITNSLNEWDHEAAREALARLRADYPDHPLVTQGYDFGDGGSQRTIADNLEDFLQRQEAWRAENADLFGKPEPGPDSTTVVFETDKGEIEIALLNSYAPQTVANFVSLCQQAYYDGTLFHVLHAGVAIEGGDPHTRDKEPEFWGTGGVNRGIQGETSKARHFRGVLATVELPESDEVLSSSRFLITVNDTFGLDGKSVVFGVVTSGMDVVDAIMAGDTHEGSERPIEPVKLESVRFP